MNRVPGVAIIALITGLIAWLQTYLGSWEYTSIAVILLGTVINLLKVYFATPEVPITDTATARGLESTGAQPPSKFSRFFF